jgi:hypothetical protein
MKFVVSKALSAYFNFYGNIHYISEVLEHSSSYSICCDCLAWQMPAPQLILRWYRLTCSWNRQWVLRVLGCWKWEANFDSGTLAQSVWRSDCGCEYCSTVGKDKDAETGAAALNDNLQSMQVHWSDASQYHDNNWWAWLWQGLSSFRATNAVRRTQEYKESNKHWSSATYNNGS